MGELVTVLLTDEHDWNTGVTHEYCPQTRLRPVIVDDDSTNILNILHIVHFITETTISSFYQNYNRMSLKLFPSLKYKIEFSKNISIGLEKYLSPLKARLCCDRRLLIQEAVSRIQPRRGQVIHWRTSHQQSPGLSCC